MKLGYRVGIINIIIEMSATISIILLHNLDAIQPLNNEPNIAPSPAIAVIKPI